MMRSKGLWMMVAAGLLAVAAVAGKVAASPDEHDHDRARQAFERGEILPLRAVLALVETDYPGEVVEVELEREAGRWRYEVKLLRAGGALVALHIDARDGTVLSVRGRHGGSHRPGR